ncbi:NADPH-dependent FMN reductase [Hutsoniella sourekii]
MTKVGVLVGSLRKESYARKWAKALVAELPAEFELEFLEIGNLPLYNEEYDQDNPQEYIDFREAVKKQDAIIIATPEYNRSTSAALKNALDVASRPWGESVWGGKPVMVLSHSISGMSGAMAAQALKPTLSFLDMPLMNQPEVYLGNSADYFNEAGELTNEDTRQFLGTVAESFVNHVKKHI